MGRNRAKEKILAHRHARMERKEQAKTELREASRGAAAAAAGATGGPVMEAGGGGGGGKKNKKSSRAVSVADGNNLGDVDGDEKSSAPINHTEDEGCGDNDNLQSGKSSEPGCGKNLTSEADNTGSKKLAKAFYTGGNPNHRMEQKPVWRYDYEESQAKTKNKEKSFEANNSSSSSTKLGDYFATEDVLNIKGMWGAKQENISPTVAAVYLSRFDVLKKILKEDNGLDSLIQDGQCMSPLGCAIVTGNWEMIEFILDKDFVGTVNCKDVFGNTALVKAACCKEWVEPIFCDFLSRMENEDIDLLSSNMAGVTLLHVISYRGWILALENLIQLIEPRPQKNLLRSAINSAMKDGTTPLMLAADVRCEEVCAMLLSHGAQPLAEDKAGYTALCRSLSGGNKAPIISRGCFPPVFCLILSALDQVKDEAENWDFEVYLSKTMQAVTNPDPVFACERFYRLGRFIFLFILRSTVGGSGLLLKSKIFSKLCSAGQKHFHQTDYLCTICLTWFEILVYAEDFPIWTKYVEAFLREGAADFCLKVLQRWTSIVDWNSDLTGDSKQQSNKCNSNTLDPDGNEYLESLASMENSVPSDKNIALSALLPFIQLIDAVGMDRWFTKNFGTISTCYRSMKQTGISANTAVSGDHVERTNQKAAIFQAVMSRENWTTMYRDKDLSESWMPRDYKNKKNRNKPPQSNADKVFCLPPEILKPSADMICSNVESDDDEGRKNDQKTSARVRKRRSPDKDVMQWISFPPLPPVARKETKISSSASGPALPNNKANSIHNIKSENAAEVVAPLPQAEWGGQIPHPSTNPDAIDVASVVASMLNMWTPGRKERADMTETTSSAPIDQKIVSPPAPVIPTSVSYKPHFSVRSTDSKPNLTSKYTDKRGAYKKKRKTSVYVTAEKFRVLQTSYRAQKGMFTEPLKIGYEVEDLQGKSEEPKNPVSPSSLGVEKCGAHTDETLQLYHDTFNELCALSKVVASLPPPSAGGGDGGVLLSSPRPNRTPVQTRTVAVQTALASTVVVGLPLGGKPLIKRRIDA